MSVVVFGLQVLMARFPIFVNDLTVTLSFWSARAILVGPKRTADETRLWPEVWR